MLDTVEERDFNLHGIAVEPELRGEGVGSRFLPAVFVRMTKDL